jgi:DNA-directed RNA polymerase specialized sigma24 family protein
MPRPLRPGDVLTGKTKHLANPKLIEDLRAYFRRRERSPEDAADLAQDAVDICMRSRRCPDDEEGCRKFAFGVAEKLMFGHIRKVERDEKHHVGKAEEQGTEDGWLLARDLVRRIGRVLPKGLGNQRALASMVAKANEGQSPSENAAEEGVSPGRLHSDRSRLRALLDKHRSELVSVIMTLWLLLIIDLRGNRRRDVADHSHDDEKVHELVPQVVPAAIGLREKAEKACAEARWKACLEALDAARDMDPRGDADARVQELRNEAEEALRALEAPPPPPPAPFHDDKAPRWREK